MAAATRFTNGYQNWGTSRGWGYYGVNPDTGNVTVSLSDTPSGITIIVYQLKFVDQATPVDDSDGDGAGTTSVVLTSGDATGLLLSGVANHANVVTPDWDNGETDVDKDINVGGYSWQVGSLAGGASITTGQSNSRNSSHVAAMFNPSGGTVAIVDTDISANITSSGDHDVAITKHADANAICVLILGEDGAGDIVSAVTFVEGSAGPGAISDLAVEANAMNPTDGNSGSDVSQTLNWTAATGSPTSHEVHRSETTPFTPTEGGGTMVADLGAAVETYESTDADGLDPQTLYYWKILAINGGGETESNEVNQTVPPAAPTLTVEQEGEAIRVTISQTASPTVDVEIWGYETATMGHDIPIADVPPAESSYLHEAPEDGETWEYVGYSHDAAGYSSASTAAQATVEIAVTVVSRNPCRAPV